MLAVLIPEPLLTNTKSWQGKKKGWKVRKLRKNEKCFLSSLTVPLWAIEFRRLVASPCRSSSLMLSPSQGSFPCQSSCASFAFSPSCASSFPSCSSCASCASHPIPMTSLTTKTVAAFSFAISDSPMKPHPNRESLLRLGELLWELQCHSALLHFLLLRSLHLRLLPPLRNPIPLECHSNQVRDYTSLLVGNKLMKHKKEFYKKKKRVTRVAMLFHFL